MTIARRNDHAKGERPPVKALLIDLDDTLYREEQIPTQVRAAIKKYMRDHLPIQEEDLEATLKDNYVKHGTTLAGLVASGYKIDFNSWHAAVHYNMIDYNGLLHPDIELRELLLSCNLPLYILTNADRIHTQRCLARLGISDCFKGIFDFEWSQTQGAAHGLLTEADPILCKPSHAMYHLVLQAMKCDASEVIFFDDSTRNILAAHEVGCRTVLVGATSLVQGADLAVPSMHALPLVLPELLDQPGLVHDGHHQHHSAALEHAGEAAEPLAALVAVASGSGAR